MNAPAAQLVEMAQAEHTREKENQDVLMEKDTNDVGVDEKKEATVNVVTANGNCNNESVGEDEVEKDATAHGVKREASTSSADSETKAKKVRNKPKPLLIENMKEYVDSNTLDKLTTATLRHWLRQQSIHCTTRDKKADLVEKVCKHFVVS